VFLAVFHFYRFFCVFFFFFFSSRRRHTRLQGDWSSDVCSSDLSKAGIRTKAPTAMSGTTTLPPASKRGLSSIFPRLRPSARSSRSEERRVGKECRYRRWRDQ